MDKKLQVILWASLFCSATGIQAQESTAQFEQLKSGIVKAISPNGKYVVGNLTAYDANMFSSYLWTTDSREQSWQTTYDETNLDKSGKYLYCNDEGLIVGSVKDADMGKTFPGDDFSDPYTYYFTNAAVWINGKLMKLGIGSYTIDDFDEEFDGSYASAISADGSVIAGYVYKGYIPQTPCGWRFNSATNGYDYFNYELPSLDGAGVINGLSADGKIAVGSVSYANVRRPVIWTSPETCKEITLGISTDPTENWGGEAAAISPNGKYALIYVNSNSTPKVAIYDIENDKTTEVPLTETYRVTGLTIDNNGNFFCRIQDNSSYDTKTYYYSTNSNMLVSMEYFMQTYAPNLTGTSITSSSVPVSMSADGTSIVGYNDGTQQSWWLKVDKSGTMVPGVSDIDVYATGIENVAVTWAPLTNIPEGTVLKAYEVYVDGGLAGTINADEAAGKSTLKYLFPAKSGSHTVYVKTLCVKNGKEIRSDASESKSINIPSSYALPMTEDFEDQSWNTNCWNRELVKGNVSDILMWNISGGSAYDFENSSYFASVTSISSDPFEATLTSHFFDARNITNPYLVFSGNLTYVNTVPKDLSTDAFDVEYTLDGETWNKIYTIQGADVKPYVWNFYKVDLSALSGKVFQLRFNAHGEGKAQLRWGIDYVTVGSELTAAPEGVRANYLKDGITDLTWKNSFGAYEESYLVNSNVIPIYNIGNGGQPLITAIDLPAAKLVNHVGEYITSVSSFIYDDPSMNSAKKTQAEAIVYADGVEVSRQAFDENVAQNPASSTVTLTTPVKIEAGKNYRVAIRIHDYDGQQSPLYYQANEKGYIAGTTDLYSEDEGKTWQTIYDFNKSNLEEARAWCIWPIRANITETATPATTAQIDSKLLAYNVYRNGVQLNTAPIYAGYMKFRDEAAIENAQYTVQAFYADGRVSALSQPATIIITAINNQLANNAISVKADAKAKMISINGKFDEAELININGQSIAKTTSSNLITAGLNMGVYILKVAQNGKTATYKMVVK